MKYYFRLRFKLLCRKLTDFGIHPLVAAIIIVPLFYYLSQAIFDNLKHAKYFYPLIALSYLLKTSAKQKDNFLKAHYLNTDVLKIKSIENLCIGMPFISFLLYKNEFYSAMLLFVISLLVSLVTFKPKTNVYIPTPFSKKPFEFSVGFRKYLLIIPICYTLSAISVSVGNANLGIFSLVALYIVCLFFYIKIEPDYYIWNHNQTPKAFLQLKIKQAIFNFLKLASPIIVLLLFFFNQEIGYILLFLMLILTALSALVLLKYSGNSSSDINPVEFFTYALCVFIFPFLIILLPYYYKKAIQKLSNIL